MPEAAAAIDELVAANHILFDQRVVDGFGHVSVRHPAARDRFLLARSMAPALVAADDVLEFDLDSDARGADGRALYLERFIHGEIYRARPDVGAVVHSHSPAVVPFSVARDAPLRALWHLGGFLGQGCPVFEIRETAGGATDLLVRNRELGAALAASLGRASVVLMRGHGCTVVGASLRQAVFNAVYTEVSAALQARAMSLGAPTWLTPEEAAAAAACNAALVDRSWELWRRRAARHRLQPQT